MKFSTLTKTLMIPGMLLSLASAHANSTAEIASQGATVKLSLAGRGQETPSAQLFKVLVDNGAKVVKDDEDESQTTVSSKSGNVSVMHSDESGRYNMLLTLKVPSSNVDVSNGFIVEEGGKTHLTQNITVRGDVARELDKVLGKNQLQGPGETLNAFRCFDDTVSFQCQFGQILN